VTARRGEELAGTHLEQRHEVRSQPERVGDRLASVNRLGRNDDPVDLGDNMGAGPERLTVHRREAVELRIVVDSSEAQYELVDVRMHVLSPLGCP
jgi:hypothetical protein